MKLNRNQIAAILTLTWIALAVVVGLRAIDSDPIAPASETANSQRAATGSRHDRAPDSTTRSLLSDALSSASKPIERMAAGEVPERANGVVPSPGIALSGLVIEYTAAGRECDTFQVLVVDPATKEVTLRADGQNGRIVLEGWGTEQVLYAAGGGAFSRPTPLPTSSGVVQVVGLDPVKLSGSVLEAGSSDFVAGAALEARCVSFDEPARAWLAEMGLGVGAGTRTDEVGRFALALPPLGLFEIQVESNAHYSATVEVLVEAALDTGRLVELRRKDGVEVELLGIDLEQLAGYQIAHTMAGQRVAIRDDGKAWLPLNPELDELTVVVFFPDDTELTAMFSDRSLADDGALAIRVGGGESLDVTVLGESPLGERMQVFLFERSDEGYESFVTRWIEPGEMESFTHSEPGSMFVDIGYIKEDHTPLTIARRRITIEAGRGASATIDLLPELKYLRLLDPTGSPAIGSEVWFGTRDEGYVGTAGGRVDAQARMVVPDRDEVELWVYGFTEVGPGERFFVDLPLRHDPRVDGDRDLRLGPVMESFVRLVDAETGAPLESRDFLVIGGHSECAILSQKTAADGAACKMRWYDGSDAKLDVGGWDVWAPRSAIALRPGALSITVTLRGWVDFRTGGRALAELVHERTGLTLQQLTADDTVKREDLPTGTRLSGIPAGAYRLRLEGESEWRGPFEALPGRWVKFELPVQ